MKFSIVTLSYDQARWLPFAMQSVFQQRHADLPVEYVVVDPGSTDGSRELAKEVEAQIDHLVLEPDRGPADGLNKGFALTTGDVLGFINADDCLEPGALARVAVYFEHNPDIDAVSGALRIIDADGNPRHRLRVPVQFTADRFLQGLAVPHQQSTFFRRSAWEATDGFRVDNRTSWDAELFVDMALAGVRFGVINAVLAQFRRHDESITSRAGNPLSDEDTLLASRMEADVRLMEQRVIESRGSSPSPPFISARRLAYHVRPVQRFREITHLGLGD